MNHLTWPLVLALVCAPVVTLEAAEGVLYVLPEHGEYTIGETFDVQVLADTDGEAINAAEAELSFNNTGLSVERISTDGSILDSWPTPPTFSNPEGVVKFSGWANEPFSGTKGLLLTVTFKALRTTASNARLAAGAILAADGRGSNIVTSMKSGLYTIEPEQVSAEVPPAPVVTKKAEVATTTETGVVSVAAPVLVAYPGLLNVGERLVVEGSASPNARVFVSLAKGDEKPEKTDVWSTPEGSFMFASAKGLTEGIYRVWAEVEDAQGRRSPLSEKATITVRASGLAAAAASSMEMMSIMLPLLALLAAVGLGIGHLAHRHKVATARQTAEYEE